MCIGVATSNSILMVIDSKGPRVLVVDSSEKIHVKQVTLGRDFGTKSEILTGLDPTDRVVQNPTEALHEGMIVSARGRHKVPSVRKRVSSTREAIAQLHNCWWIVDYEQFNGWQQLHDSSSRGIEIVM
jgi:hypothetical protein